MEPEAQTRSAGAARGTLIVAAACGVLPLVVSFAHTTTRVVDGHATSSYRDWIAIGGGAAAIGIGLVAIGLCLRARLRPLVACAVGVVALGGYQVARGLGAFHPAAPALEVAGPPSAPPGAPPPRAVIADPATCPDADACDRLAADLATRDPAGALAATSRACELGQQYDCVAAANGWKGRAPTDRARAQALLGKGCDLGNQTACNDLAVELLGGPTADPPRARDLLIGACTSGELLACKNLVVIHRDGAPGVAKDPEAAFGYGGRACGDGRYDSANADDVAWACTYSGVQLWTGDGRKVDQAGAVERFAAACDRHPRYCYDLGVAYDNGGGVAKDQARARGLYERACEAGDLDACNDLAVDAKHGIGGDRDVARARALFQRACDGGVAHACTNLKAK